MSERAALQHLQQLAHQAMAGAVVPALEGNARYQALMVARVLAVAAREAELGAEAESQESIGIEAFVAQPGQSLEASRAALCREIASGRFDSPGPERDALLAHLELTNENRLRITNPKALEGKP